MCRVLGFRDPADDWKKQGNAVLEVAAVLEGAAALHTMQ